MKYVALCFTIVLFLSSDLFSQRRVFTHRPTATSRPTPQASGGRLGNRSLLPRMRQFRRLQNLGNSRRSFSRTQAPGQMKRSNRITSRPEFSRMTPADRSMQQRLASIDRMRDYAIESNNPGLLDRADYLERQVRSGSTRQRSTLARTFSRFPTAAQDQRDPRSFNTDGITGREFGQGISAKARELGREFGQFTAKQARELGREFGKSNADKTRLLEPLPEVPEEPADPPSEPTEPIDGGETTTVSSDSGV